MIPDFDFGALVGEELHDLRQALVGCPVHGGFTVVVHRVNVAPEIQSQLHCLERFRLGSGFFKGGNRPNAGSCHQRSGVMLIAEQRVGAQLDQQAHEGRVVGRGSQKEWRCANSTQQASARLPALEPCVDVRSMLHQFPDELETAEISRANGSRIPVVAVTTVWFAHPRRERSETRALVIISPCVQRCFRQFEMTILNRQNEDSFPSWDLCLKFCGVAWLR